MDTTSVKNQERTALSVTGRALLLLVAGITTVLTLSLLVNDLVRVLYMFDGAYDLHVLLGSPQGVPSGLDGDTEVTQSYISSVLLSSQLELQAARTLQVIAIVLTTLTFVASAATILLLCRRLWTRRTFATSAAVSLLVVAGLTLATAWLAPWLRHRADEVALESMGYSTSGGALWVELPYYDVWSPDGAVFVLGVVLGLTALVYLGSKNMQRDTEGLI